MRPFVSASLLLGVLAVALSGCGSAPPPEDLVFEVKVDGFTPDGRPIIEIQPNGKPRPKGEGPYGDYFLVLRSSSDKPYTRQFDKDQAEKGIKLDFMVSKKDFKPSDKITVAVENPQKGSFEDVVRLSNVINVEFP